jgi:hypothetical protein
MIIQITRVKNEILLLKEMFAIWSNYADGFVFLDDQSTDGTYEFLVENKQRYNIISILRTQDNKSDLAIESNDRQILFDEALKYSNKIICLDADEYLDGNLSKIQLSNFLDENKDTLVYLPWIQYTSKNEIRVDGPWRSNFKDRVGSYSKACNFANAQMHSEHLPNPGRSAYGNVPVLFIAHLQWLDKKVVAMKQYFWKVTDYVNKIRFNCETFPPSAYDTSVSNFEWTCENFPFELKVNSNIFSSYDIENSYKYKFIVESIKRYNIPNLNDWGMGIHKND